MSNVKFLNNDEGVSPIVATLVLIVVAIVGAAAVGLIMGSFSSSVSQQANSGNTAASASTTINVAGSTSMQPVITTLAQWYNANNTGVKVNVVGGGSGAGYVSVGQGIADIGMISEAPAKSQLAKYPNLKAYQVGASGVVFADGSGTSSTITKAELVTLFSQATSTFSITTAGGKTYTEVVDRSDVSGTQDTAMAYLGITPGAGVTAKSGNGGVEGEIKNKANAIGILDSDYAFGASSTDAIAAQNIDDGSSHYIATAANVLDEIKNNNGKYAPGLIRALNLITNGPASSINEGFIQFCQSPAVAGVFTAANQVGVTSVNPAFLA
jgi:phosphate transport system substrate-binding protein